MAEGWPAKGAKTGLTLSSLPTWYLISPRATRHSSSSGRRLRRGVGGGGVRAGPVWSSGSAHADLPRAPQLRAPRLPVRSALAGAAARPAQWMPAPTPRTAPTQQADTPCPPAQQRDQLLDACLVLAVRVLLGAVGAARHLPLDVGPDAAQLLRRGAGNGTACTAWAQREQSVRVGNAARQRRNAAAVHDATKARSTLMGYGLPRPPTRLRQLRHLVHGQQRRQLAGLGAVAVAIAVAVAVGAGGGRGSVHGG